MKWRITNWEKACNNVVLVLSVIIILISIKDWAAGTEMRDGVLHSKINNYLIFKNSFGILAEGGNLYDYHKDLHFDLYKYSPAFAMAMAPLYFLPDWLGLSIWNLLNFLCLYFGLKILPGLSEKKVLIIIGIGLLELLGSIMNEQSNGLMAGMIILSLALMENKKTFWALGILVISVYVKLFSIVFLSILLFYPNFLKNVGYALIWFVFLAIIPAIIIGTDQLIALYKSWAYLLANDHQMSQGYSLMGILNSWFGYFPNKLYLLICGLVLAILPLFRYGRFSSRLFRYKFVAMLLAWVIVFNHKSESPTFIIAMTGIGLWYVIDKQKAWRSYFLLFALFAVSIAFSDAMPKLIREAFFYKYSMKALPCVVFLVIVLWELTFTRGENYTEEIDQFSVR
ncbi:MAG: glycosyltransferase family 87 protein [Vicingaceae bacterium]